jgi:hypothetical protein
MAISDVGETLSLRKSGLKNDRFLCLSGSLEHATEATGH